MKKRRERGGKRKKEKEKGEEEEKGRTNEAIDAFFAWKVRRTKAWNKASARMCRLILD